MFQECACDGILIVCCCPAFLADVPRAFRKLFESSGMGAVYCVKDYNVPERWGTCDCVAGGVSLPGFLSSYSVSFFESNAIYTAAVYCV